MEFDAPTIPEAYVEGLWKLRIFGHIERSRVGPVITIPEPVLMTIYNPTKRILADEIRNANPFFHVMESIWMLAGQQDPTWVAQFNKGILNYADDGIINGAYGHRWLKTWGPQIPYIIQLLKEEPTTRQAVLTMWDPHTDLFDRHWSDRPCNTHIYFRNVHGKLNMTVCNRSNDFVWGMMGANAVHMTILHEFVASAVGMLVGDYRVFTNNLHFYLNLYPNGDEIIKTTVLDSVIGLRGQPILYPGEDWQRFLLECKMFVDGKFDGLKIKWLKNTALPMYHSYLVKDQNFVEDIAAEDWREACKRWLVRNRPK